MLTNFFLLNAQPGEILVLAEVTPSPLSSDPRPGNNVTTVRTTVRRLGASAQTIQSAGAKTASAEAAVQTAGSAPSAKLGGWEVRR
jgi:hypothetical protein